MKNHQLNAASTVSAKKQSTSNLDHMKQQYKSHTKAYLKAAMKDIEVTLNQKVDKAFESGAIPEEWIKTGNYLLMKAVIDSFCIDRPYQGLNSTTKKESANLHKFI